MEDSKITADSFFTFSLGKGLFALPVTSVREVLNYSDMTFVPKALPYIKGVMNIRGSVIPVVDLRILFGFEPVVEENKSSIIVAEVPQENEQPLVLALLADHVDQVSQLELVPTDTVAYGTMEQRKDFVKSVARKDGNFVLILDIVKVMESIDKELIQAGGE